MEKTVAIRQLVEFIFKTGDLVSQKNSQHTALEGARIHRRLQKEKQKKDPNYQKEVAVKFSYSLEDWCFILKGRMDGLYEEKDLWVIEEIKTSEDPFELLTAKQVDLFFAQGLCYAYFILQEKKLEKIAVDLVYFEVLTEQITVKRRELTKEDVTKFMAEMMATFLHWEKLKAGWQDQALSSVATLKFPFENFRKGQHQLMGVVYKALANDKPLLVQAPTGTGKTMSTLFPALKALGTKKFPTIFYLTAKTSTQQGVVEALKVLEEKGLALKAVVITAKDKVSLGQDIKDPNPYEIGYYDRVNEGLEDILTHENFITREIITAYGKKHQLDPFEFSLDISLFCSVVICDYNYVFDPFVYLKRFFDYLTPESAPLLLMDEVHNLVDRSKSMYSIALSLNETRKVGKILKKVGGKDSLSQQIRRRFNKILRLLEDLEVTHPKTFTAEKDLPEDLLKALANFLENFFEWFNLQKFPEEKPVLDWGLNAQKFLRMTEFFNEEFLFAKERKNDDFLVEQICLDPAEFLQKRYAECANVILFSATLEPFSYYEERLGLVDNVRFALSSPFPKSQQQVIITDYIATTYQKRGANIGKILEAIFLLGKSKRGNYLIFCPSHTFLLQVYEAFMEKYPDEFQVVKQETQLLESEREAFLAEFQAPQQKSFLAFAVLGGIFSEGIDLKGERLSGCAIIGVGLPQLNPVTDLEREYYDEKNHQGFLYAYQLPGMNKVLQAAGRVIRTPFDWGVVLLLDERYVSSRYRHYLPPDWQVGLAHNPVGLQEGLKNFWLQQKD